MAEAKSDVLLASLTKFFQVPEHSAQLNDILGRNAAGVSLRKLERFVTNYAKTNHVTYTTPAGKMFTVHVAYKSSLDGYSKKLFDPFCRTSRIEFQGHTTTCAQLNFLKWAISNGIVGYLKTSELKETASAHTRLKTQAPRTHNSTRIKCSQSPSPSQIQA